MAVQINKRNLEIHDKILGAVETSGIFSSDYF